jgi:hypothetical protein
MGCGFSPHEAGERHLSCTVAIVMKAIKARRFNDAAFRQAIESEIQRVADEIEADFKATTATWKRQVKFEKIISFTPPVEVLVGTDDEIYRYVDEGTRPHPIFPVRAKALAFPSGYSAKTTPGVIGSKPGGGFGPTVFAAYVYHPGTEARHFDKVIQQKWQTRFKRRMEAALSRAAKASGHGI